MGCPKVVFWAGLIARVQESHESVEKVGSSEETKKRGDGKCLEEPRKSFVGFPSAIQFL